MRKKVDLSVIILSFNTRSLLYDCLRSVLKAAKTASAYQIQIIVVDNASKDKSSQMVKKAFPQVGLIQNRKNLGFSAGNNVGLKKARGGYVLFLNSDTIVSPRAFQEIITFLNQNPGAGAVSAKTMLASGRMDPDCHRGFPTPWASLTYFLGLERLFPRSRIFGQYHQFFKNLDKVHEIDAGAGAFMVVRRKMLRQVGNWDEGYFFYGEDLDFFYRIKKGGWQVLFYPRPLLTHYKGASSGLRKESRGKTRPSRKTRLQVARASVQAMEIFYRKFYRDVYPRWLTWLVLLAIRLKGFLRITANYLRKD
ncbi:MAG: glycosyltransferase family 2 protein [Candidatus Pacebacteria bacterium]|nr:glycosyltransferase family 2 protein [Candidatus Paceibacterota bacterium]